METVQKFLICVPVEEDGDSPPIYKMNDVYLVPLEKDSDQKTGLYS